MKKQKMSLSNMQGKLSRDEMKNVMGGLMTTQGLPCCSPFIPVTCNCDTGPGCNQKNACGVA